jgi:hypothetical protein
MQYDWNSYQLAFHKWRGKRNNKFLTDLEALLSIKLHTIRVPFSEVRGILCGPGLDSVMNKNLR